MRKIFFFIIAFLQLCAIQLKADLPKKPLQQLFSLLDLNVAEDQILSYLQQHWLQKNKERWEMEPLFEEKKEEALPLLSKIGYIHPILPQKKHYDYALVLGAIGSTMQARLDFLYEQCEKGVHFDQIVLLSGERELDPAREDFPTHMQTEAQLLQYLFENHPLKDIAPFILIDSGKKNGRRPTTEITIQDWLATCPKKGSCLFISSQPFVNYQRAVVKAVLKEKFEIEVIGNKTGKTFPMSVYLDTLAKQLFYEQKQ